MGKKYIIKLDDNTLAYTAILIDGVPYIKPLQLLPYTEPDIEQVRKEGYNKGFKDGTKKCINCEDFKENAKAEAYQKGLSDGKNQDAKDFADMYDSGYNEGLKAAWECARKICAMDSATRDKIFGLVITSNIFDENTASEAIEKIWQYGQKQEEKNLDEIEDVLKTTVKECGVSLDEIAEVLKKMKGRKNE